jgi:hypothetical protein
VLNTSFAVQGTFGEARRLQRVSVPSLGDAGS